MKRAQIATALADEQVKEIVLDINSGGGHAVGCKELADYIFSKRAVKPITRAGQLLSLFGRLLHRRSLQQSGSQ